MTSTTHFAVSDLHMFVHTTP